MQSVQALQELGLDKTCPHLSQVTPHLAIRPPTSTPYLAQLSLDRQKWSLAESAHGEGQTGAPRLVTQERGGPGPTAPRGEQAAVPAALTAASCSGYLRCLVGCHHPSATAQRPIPKAQRKPQA